MVEFIIKVFKLPSSADVNKYTSKGIYSICLILYIYYLSFKIMLSNEILQLFNFPIRL